MYLHYMSVERYKNVFFQLRRHLLCSPDAEGGLRHDAGPVARVLRRQNGRTPLHSGPMRRSLLVRTLQNFSTLSPMLCENKLECLSRQVKYFFTE